VTIDKKQFEEHLFRPDSSFEILLRGHLWIENLINEILAVHIVDSSALDVDRMAFRQKIDMAQAFGFISPGDGRAFRELNKMRNKLAHNLWAEPSESEVQGLVNTLYGPVKAMFEAVMSTPDVVKQSGNKFFHLRYWFFCYAMHLDYACARKKYEKENAIKLIQVAAVRVASRDYAHQEVSEEDARRQFDLADPPDPADSWR
jgi:hypothetical protein